MFRHHINVVMLLVLSAVWSTGYILIALADASIPPVTLTAIRAWLAAGMLLVLSLVLRRPLRQAKPWHPAYLAPAFLLSSFPWTLTAEGELYIDAGLTALLTSLTPISTFVIAAWILRTESAHWSRLVGLVLSLSGLALAIGVESLLQARVSLVGLALVCTAFTMYGVNGILLGRWGKGLDPLVTCTYAIGYGAVLITVAAFTIEDPLTIQPRTEDLVALVLLGTVVTAGGYALYFSIIKRAGAMFASTWGYLVPAFGIVLSALWLGTPLDWERIAGTILAIGGVFLINRRKG